MKRLFVVPTILFAIIILLLHSFAMAEALDLPESESTKNQAKRIFRRLTSINISDTDPRLAKMIEFIESGNPLDAARIASDDMQFLNVLVRQWVAPWSSQTASTLNELDDMQATGVGIVRDRLDIRLLLTGDFRFEGKAGIGLPLTRSNSNRHYQELENFAFGLADVLVRVPESHGRKIGIFGSRGFAKEYYSAGTNRRAVTFAFEHFLCQPITSWREITLPDRYVRRDVNRTPTGNLREYQTECRGCHAAMDAFSGAFAYVDFVDNQVSFPSTVAPKFNIHPEVFPDGKVVTDGAWENYLVRNQNHVFGWRGETKGNTLEQFSQMLSNSRAFSSCMVQRAAVLACPSAQPELYRQLTDVLEANGYDMRLIFELASLESNCRRN